MAYQQCPTCGVWSWIASHQCPPVWLVRLDHGEPEEDAKRIYAEKATAAAEEYVERQFSQLDYPSFVELLVKPEAAPDAAWEPFEVEVEAMPVFRARKRKKEPTL